MTHGSGRLARLAGLATYGAIRAAIGAMGVLDMPTALAVARRAGGAFAGARFNRGRLKRATDNLAIAFPDWTPDKCEHYAIAAYEHLFMLGIELAYTPRLLTQDGWAGRVELHDLGLAVRTVVGSRPLVIVSGHCGNWEMSGYSMAMLGFPLYALYRPLDLAPLDRWVRDTRERRGLTLLDKFGAMRKIPAVMSAGAPVAFVADQNAGVRGLFVPYFGRLASTYKAIGLSATRFDAVVLCGIATRMGGESVPGLEGGELHCEPTGLRYRLMITDVFGPEEYRAQPDPLFYIAARYRRAIEKAVRIAPEQYLWMHRFWRARPRFEREGKPIPEAMIEKIRALPWTTEEEIERIVENSRRDAAACAAAA